MGRQENVEIFEDTFALCKQNSTLRNAIKQSTKKQKLYASFVIYEMLSTEPSQIASSIRAICLSANERHTRS